MLAVHGLCLYPLWDSPIEAQLYMNKGLGFKGPPNRSTKMQE